jgi:hypothetical protein
MAADDDAVQPGADAPRADMHAAVPAPGPAGGGHERMPDARRRGGRRYRGLSTTNFATRASRTPPEKVLW